MSGDAITAIGAVLIAAGVTAFGIFLYLAIASNEHPIVPAAGSYYLRVWRLSDRDLTPFKVNFARILPFKGWGYVAGVAAGVACAFGGAIMPIV